MDDYAAGRLTAEADTGSLRGDLMAVMDAMAGHLTPEFLAMMSGLVHAMRTNSELAAALRPRLGQACAAPRGQYPGFWVSRPGGRARPSRPGEEGPGSTGQGGR